MRIIAGKLKGSKLSMPIDKNTRPLKDLVKESIFNLLIHSNKMSFKFNNSYVLDLYSGTGSFGIECLSRQTKKVYFVENNNNVLEILKKNIEKFKLNNKAKIFFGDVFEFNEKQIKFDLIFCDPPYKNQNLYDLIESIYNKNLLKKEGVIILHRNKNSEDKFPEFFNFIDERFYGISKIIYGRFLS